MVEYATHEWFARPRGAVRLSLLTVVGPNDCDQTEITGNTSQLCLESSKIGFSNGISFVTDEGLASPMAHYNISERKYLHTGSTLHCSKILLHLVSLNT
jgi:hypothetical protein